MPTIFTWRLKIEFNLPSDEHRYHQQVEDSSADPVPNPIVGASGDSGMMRHRHFFHDRPGTVHQDRNKAMDTLKSRKGFEHAPLKDTKVAAGVGIINAQDQFPGRTRNARGEATQHAIRPRNPDAADHVTAAEFLEHTWQVGRIVLQVSVQRRNDAPLAGPKTGKESRALPQIHRVTDAADPRVGLLGLEDVFPGAIGATVINQNQLDALHRTSQGLQNPPHQRLDVPGFVMEGHDD